MTEEAAKYVTVSSPTLTPEERLYVRAYMSSLSHKEAHATVCPSLKSHSNTNPFTKRDNVMFYINRELMERAEALSLNPDRIMQLMYKEATREGKGSQHAARVQAITLLGKQLGMFKDQDKQQDYKPVINIINYNPTSGKVETGKVDEVTEVKKIEKNIEEDIDGGLYDDGY